MSVLPRLRRYPAWGILGKLPQLLPRYHETPYRMLSSVDRQARRDVPSPPCSCGAKQTVILLFNHAVALTAGGLQACTVEHRMIPSR